MKFKISKIDFKNAINLHTRAKYLRHYFAIISLFAILSLTRCDLRSGISFFASAAVIFAIYTILMRAFLNWKATRQYDESEEYKSEMEMSIINNELSLVTDKTATLIPRNRILKTKSNQQVVLLYRTSIMFHLIPKAIFDECDDVKEWLSHA